MTQPSEISLKLRLSGKHEQADIQALIDDVLAPKWNGVIANIQYQFASYVGRRDKEIVFTDVDAMVWPK